MAIHKTAIIDDGAILGDDVQIGPYCVVGPSVRIANGVTIKSHVVIGGFTDIGAQTEISPYAVLGEPPQHVNYRNEKTSLVIGANNKIREYVSFNCGTVDGGGVTQVGDNGFFMVGSNLAHDCQVGGNVILANNATVGGHVKIGDHAFLGGVCAVHQYCRIGDYGFIGGGAIVTTDVIPHASVVGNHAYLAGLNVIGMKRRGMARETIHELRKAYQILFHEEGAFSERLGRVRAELGSSVEVARILDFIDEDGSRSLMMPER